MLSPVVPYSSWARESRMLLAKHLLRAKGGGQGATLSLSAEADWTALAGPGVSQGSWQNRNSLRAERPALPHEGGGRPRRKPQCCRLGVSTSRVRRGTRCGQGVGAGVGTQTSSRPAHSWA